MKIIGDNLCPVKIDLIKLGLQFGKLTFTNWKLQCIKNTYFLIPNV